MDVFYTSPNVDEPSRADSLRSCTNLCTRNCNRHPRSNPTVNLTSTQTLAVLRWLLLHLSQSLPSLVLQIYRLRRLHRPHSLHNPHNSYEKHPLELLLGHNSSSSLVRLNPNLRPVHLHTCHLRSGKSCSLNLKASLIIKHNELLCNTTVVPLKHNKVQGAFPHQQGLPLS